ncbi:MAG: cation:proton antiporter [Nitrososphaerota archaeon]|nr:cation:proton antiporter [Nitrososphaerota archaeon]MDG7016630.1 cation:proton antiporter [Nitrososphaerota archaeon]
MALTVEVLAVFLLLALGSVLVSRKVKVPFTMLLVFVGLALAAAPISSLAGLNVFFNNLASEQLFVGLILPPLLFESVIGVKLADFRAVYRPALLLATVGVLISTLVVGVVLWKVVGLSVLVAFLFAALISPTDVATVLEVFRRVNVPTRLATLIEMESVFNDSTAIAIFTVVLATSAAVALQPLEAVAYFSYTLSGGILVGLGVAWAARRLQPMIDDSVTQVVLTLAAVYGAYAVATSLGTSGLIAVAVTGLYYGNTVLFNVESKQIAEATRQFWGIVAFVANAAAFFFIGISTNLFLLATTLGAFLVAYAVVVMARITSVYPILSLSRVAGTSVPSSWMNTTMLGGMRGALAIALVSDIPFATRGPVATLTFGVVMLSILLQGPLLSRYTKRAFGAQQTLQRFVIPDRIYDMEGAPAPAEALSPDPEGGKTDELR